jgi:hypothetical protein
MHIVEQVRGFISSGRLDKAFDVLIPALQNKDNELYNRFLLLQGTLKKAKRDSNIGVLTNQEFLQINSKIGSDVFELLDEVSTLIPAETKEAPVEKNIPEQKAANNSAKTVFISYNHNDSAVADKLKEELRKASIEVFIDKEKMLAGEDIKTFIEKCVKDSNITLSVVSKKSLMSAWVAMESVNSFFHEKTSEKKFIACFIDDSFFSRGFTDEALDIIDVEVADIQDTIKKRMDRGRGISDLENELKRYRNLQNNIDEIIRRLRESLCINIKDDNFEKNFPKILEAIKA